MWKHMRVLTMLLVVLALLTQGVKYTEASGSGVLYVIFCELTLVVAIGTFFYALSLLLVVAFHLFD